MNIGALAKHTHVGVETIRYYEKLGLLSAPPRQANGYRCYSSAHLQRLSFIRHCRALDISLSDIKRLLEYQTHPEDNCCEVNALIDTKLLEVRQRLDSLHALEQQLAQLRQRCASQQVKDCGILHELSMPDH